MSRRSAASTYALLQLSELNLLAVERCRQHLSGSVRSSIRCHHSTLTCIIISLIINGCLFKLSVDFGHHLLWIYPVERLLVMLAATVEADVTLCIAHLHVRQSIWRTPLTAKGSHLRTQFIHSHHFRVFKTGAPKRCRLIRYFVW